jgi:hypothetical protein
MNSLIIPMLVEAYASGNLRPSQKDVPKMAPDYKTALANSVLGSKNTPGILEKKKPLEPGIHLHFILPDAFTHSTDGQDYPAVPNRYIITRIWKDDTINKLLAKCSVVESDFISTDKIYSNSITIPFFSDPDMRKMWRYLGRNYPVERQPVISGKEQYLDKLTAMGAGDPLFAAYYPNCRSVFGFYDDLKDLPAAPSIKLTYFVTGYFTDESKDPFAKVKTAEDYRKVLESLQLSIVSMQEICNSCEVYGAIDGIDWKGFEAEYCPSPQGKVNVVFANTSAEALSYTVKNAVGTGTDFTERMLTALQYELYDEREILDGNFIIDDVIHLNSFSRFESQDKDIYLSVDGNTSLRTEDNLGLEFSNLKKLGDLIGDNSRKLYFERKKLFSAWEQYVLLYEDAAKLDNFNPSREVMLEEIKNICEKIEKISDDVNAKSEEYEEKVKRFSMKLPNGVTCSKSAKEVFYAPKDPVLLMSGQGINRTYAYGEDGRFTYNGTLLCQTSPVITDISRSEIFDQCFKGLGYLTDLPILYSELLLQTSVLCHETFSTIKSIFTSINVIGELPSKIAMNEDPFNWTTLYMIWGADYHPTTTVMNPDNTLKDWSLEYGDTNLKYMGKLQPEQLVKKHIEGKMLLTPHAVTTFSSVIKRYAQIYEKDDKLNELAEKIKNLAIISQNLSGFSDYFSGFWQALQFPIIGIGEPDVITQMVTDNINHERASILPESSLMPVYGGYTKITDLSLVSSFGQVQTLISPSYYNSDEVDFAETVHSDIKDYGLLRPSFSVPTRLNADYISASDEQVYTSPAPETSPVCGILIPEMLNRRLLAYTADGTYLGMVKTVYRNKKPAARWLSAPNMNPDFDKLDIPDEYLRSFLKNLFTSNNAFYEFNGLMDLFLNNKQNFTTLIWGRPLVLARTKLNFEFYGNPQYSKRYEDFGKNDTHGVEKERFDLGFGDIERITDGFLGCFDGGDFTKMYPPYGAVNPYLSEDYIQYSKSLTIANSDGDRFFCWLLEPAAPVNIQTGILPVKTVYFEPVHAAIAENLDLSAEISPVLGTLGQIGLPPLPQTEGNPIFEWYVLDKEDYIQSQMIPPMATFDETILMDGFIVKERS